MYACGIERLHGNLKDREQCKRNNKFGLDYYGETSQIHHFFRVCRFCGSFAECVTNDNVCVYVTMLHLIFTNTHAIAGGRERERELKEKETKRENERF